MFAEGWRVRKCGSKMCTPHSNHHLTLSLVRDVDVGVSCVFRYDAPPVSSSFRPLVCVACDPSCTAAHPCNKNNLCKFLLLSKTSTESDGNINVLTPLWKLCPTFRTHTKQEPQGRRGRRKRRGERRERERGRGRFTPCLVRPFFQLSVPFPCSLVPVLLVCGGGVTPNKIEHFVIPKYSLLVWIQLVSAFV